MIGRVDINVADVRRESAFRSGRVTQALFNELLEIFDERGGYFLIKGEDNSEGWIDRRFVVEHDSFADGDLCLVTSNIGSGYEKPEVGSKRVTSIPYGCRLYGVNRGDFMMIESARYGELYIPADDIQKETSMPFSPERLIHESEKFLGAPYLWGGRSFFGFDCSGFAQCIMKRFGINLPRDSKDQRRSGEKAGRDDIRAGDLLFFPGHVTIAVSNHLMIHSSLGNGGVAYNSLDPQSPLYSEYYDKNFAAARRFIK